jgi:hypothetical protein
MLSVRCLSRVLPVAALISSLAAPASPQQPSCSADVHRAFDFWLGEWEVRTADGVLVGHNQISRLAGACGITESWNGRGGSVGKSVNMFDPADGQWHQLWVDNGGRVLRLAGAAEDGSMRMTGRGNDTSRLHEVTWNRLGDGRVEQVWRISSDEGESWSTAFEGYYTRLATPELTGGKLPACDTPQGGAFDFWPGFWRVESRQKESNGDWVETEGIWRAEPMLEGCGFLDYTTGDYGSGAMTGVGSRFYDPDRDVWTITWVSTEAPGRLGIWTGSFDEQGTGEFLRENETPGGPVVSRIRWYDVTPTSADWDYSVSRDGGETWTVLWEMNLTKFERFGE